MDELKYIFASNLIKLRTGAGMTQAELAEKINYSDKSISKWERAEAIPDAYVLKKMSEIFNVSIDQMLTEEGKWKPQTLLTPLKDKKETYSQLSIILCIIASIFTFCLTECILVWLILDSFHWFVMYAFLPISLIVLLVLNSIWYGGRRNMYIIMALVLTIVVFAFLLFPMPRAWLILILLIPAELIVYLAFQIKGKFRKAEAKAQKEALEKAQHEAQKTA